MQKFMGGKNEQIFQGNAVDSWEENRDRLHGDGVEFGHKWYSILGIRPRFGQKDPSNRLERRRIWKNRQKAGHSFRNLSTAQLQEQTAKLKAHTSVTL